MDAVRDNNQPALDNETITKQQTELLAQEYDYWLLDFTCPIWTAGNLYLSAFPLVITERTAFLSLSK
jgi:hypothetical protein